MGKLVLQRCLDRQSQFSFDSLNKEGGLYEDMHGLHRDQGDTSQVVHTVRIPEIVHIRGLRL